MAEYIPSGRSVEKTFIYDKTITEDHARRLARLCIRDRQSFALVPDGRKWAAWCPLAEKDRFINHVENSREE